jgi:tetratricopeptide (TPR) repeat protein
VRSIITFNIYSFRKEYFILFLCAVIPYLGILGNDINIWDDRMYVIENPFFGDLSFSMLKRIFYEYLLGNYHPITMLIMAVEFSLNGFSPFVFHGFSLVLHIIICFQVLSIAKKFIGENAIYAALLFAVHPLHVESVAWVSEQKDLLYTLFICLAFQSWINFRETGKSNAVILFFICFLLGCLSKAMAVSLFPVILLTDYFFFKKSRLTKKEILIYLFFLCICLLTGLVAIKAQEASEAIDLSGNVSWPQRFGLAGYGLLNYFFRLIVPFGFSVFHPYPTIRPGVIDPLIPFYSIILIVFLGLCYLAFKKHKLLFYGLMVFLMTLVLVLQILPVGAASWAERYAYVPSIAWSIIIVALLKQYNLLNKKSFILSFISTLVLIIYGGLTFGRTLVWKNEITIWEDVVKKYPDTDKGLCNRGLTYFRIGKKTAAISDLKAVINANPNYLPALAGLAEIYAAVDSNAAAMNMYSKILERKPNSIEALNGKGVLLAVSGQHDKALDLFKLANAISPNDPTAYYNIGNAYYFLNYFDEAKKWYFKAIEKRPLFPKALNNIGNVFLKEKEYRSALAYFEKAKKIDPKLTDIDKNITLAKEKLNQPKKNESGKMSLKSDDPIRKAELLASENRIQEAIFIIDSVISRGKADGFAYLLKAKILIGLKDLENANKMIQVALEKIPDEADVHFQAAIISNLKGLPEAELYHLKKAIQLSPDYGPYPFELGLYYLNKNMKDSACYYLKKAKNLGVGEAIEPYEQYCGN